MHEVGVLMEVVKSVETFAKRNSVTKIEKIVLQIGELSSMIPSYIEVCYPAAVDGTVLEDAKLEIEILPGNAICKKCNTIFNVIQNKGMCPNCNDRYFELLGGKEFIIKHIVAC